MFSSFNVYVGTASSACSATAPNRRGTTASGWCCPNHDPADRQLRREFPSLRRIQLLGASSGIGSSFP